MPEYNFVNETLIIDGQPILSDRQNIRQLKLFPRTEKYMLQYHHFISRDEGCILMQIRRKFKKGANLH